MTHRYIPALKSFADAKVKDLPKWFKENTSAKNIKIFFWDWKDWYFETFFKRNKINPMVHFLIFTSFTFHYGSAHWHRYLHERRGH